MDWTLWDSKRPTDPKRKYRWRIPERVILKKLMRPEWTQELSRVGMGYAETQYWPSFSDWDGYKRTVPQGLEWRFAEEDETDIYWGGFELLPCPFTGKQPKIDYHGIYINAPPFRPEHLSIKSWLVFSCGWTDANKLQEFWNTRV